MEGAPFVLDQTVSLTCDQVPVILYLERIDMRDQFDFTALPDALDPSILSRDVSISL